MPKRIYAAFALLALLAVSLVAAIAAYADGPTTVDRTIGDSNGDNRLEVGAGDGYLTRLLAHPSSDRADTRKRLINFGQVTDTHVVDEESPARLEMFDEPMYDLLGVGSAGRPQEAVLPQVVGAMTERLNGITSPVDGAPVENFVVTGDNTDNMHKNEVRDYIDALNGGTVDPDSGEASPLSDPPGCTGPYPSNTYQGVKGDGGNAWSGFYDPDTTNDGAGYSDDENANVSTRGRHIASRDFPELLEKAQQSFQSPGLGAPWYTAFGNHDSTMLGTLFGPTTPDLWTDIENAAVGCHKWLQGDTFAGQGNFVSAVFFALFPGGTSDCVPIRKLEPCSLVQPDPERDMLGDPQEWIAEHFNNPTGTPDGHGFADRDSADATYYSTSLKPGVRLISLDTTNRDFFAEGSVGHDQFVWLESKLNEAEADGELVVVIGHHTLRTMNNGFDFDPIDPEYHFGLKGETGLPGGHPYGKSLEELFLENPNVIAFVNGHEHQNYVAPHTDSGSENGFWEISTAAHIDWPQQSRLIEVFDNCDGTISMFGTLVDHAGPTDPGDTPNLDDSLTLAGIARELSHNDPQSNTGEDGTSDARGVDAYRNVELVDDNPLGETEACNKDEGGGGTQPGGTTGTGGTSSSAQGVADTDAPHITKLKANRKRTKRAKIRRSPAKAIFFKFKLSENATVKIKLTRKVHGKTKTVGTIKLSGEAGTNKAKVSKSLAKKLARIASYKATAQARDAAGNTSDKESVSFSVVRG